MKNLSLNLKLLLAFLLCSSFLLVVGVSSYLLSHDALHNYEEIGQENVPNLVEFIHLKELRARMVIPLARLYEAPTSLEKSKEAREEFEKTLAMFLETAKAYESHSFVEGEEAQWHAFKKSFDELTAMSRKMIELSASSNKADLELRDRLWEEDFKKIRNENLTLRPHQGLRGSS